MCAITGLTGPISESAFIEWYYYIEYGVTEEKKFLTGKMTFSASATYIDNMVNTYGALGPNGLGIPLFVQPSHNQF
jgi:hypothetical protein